MRLVQASLLWRRRTFHPKLPAMHTSQGTSDGSKTLNPHNRARWGPVFKTACFNRSHIPPHERTLLLCSLYDDSGSPRPAWCSRTRPLPVWHAKKIIEALFLTAHNNDAVAVPVATSPAPFTTCR